MSLFFDYTIQYATHMQLISPGIAIVFGVFYETVLAVFQVCSSMCHSA